MSNDTPEIAALRKLRAAVRWGRKHDSADMQAALRAANEVLDNRTAAPIPSPGSAPTRPMVNDEEVKAAAEALAEALGTEGAFVIVAEAEPLATYYLSRGSYGRVFGMLATAKELVRENMIEGRRRPVSDADA